MGNSPKAETVRAPRSSCNAIQPHEPTDPHRKDMPKWGIFDTNDHSQNLPTTIRRNLIVIHQERFWRITRVDAVRRVAELLGHFDMCKVVSFEEISVPTHDGIINQASNTLAAVEESRVVYSDSFRQTKSNVFLFESLLTICGLPPNTHFSELMDFVSEAVTALRRGQAPKRKAVKS